MATAEKKTPKLMVDYATFEKVASICENNLHPTCHQADLRAILQVCSEAGLVETDPAPVPAMSRGARKELADAEERGREAGRLEAEAEAKAAEAEAKKKAAASTTGK